MVRTYSIKKSRSILHACFSWLQKKSDQLPNSERNKCEETLRKLENAIFAKKKEKASLLAQEAEKITKKHTKKTSLYYAIEIGVAILFALLIATVVRQMWFELYEIPTGSMRPSFREQDRLTVTKTQFGINVPLATKHFYFDPDLVERGKVFIFSGENIPQLDEQTHYFGILPYTKRYIKRLIGKPGDSLYFYGGKIWGVDKEGNPIDILLNDPWMEKIEHIPLITFEGEPIQSSRNSVILQHMGESIGKLTYTESGDYIGEINVNGRWRKEKPFDKTPSSFGDFWGIGNFAKVRLLDRDELEKYTDFNLDEVEEAPLYLQLRHTPNLTYPTPRQYVMGSRMGIQLPTLESVIPLQDKHIQAIKDHMYTSRFVVKNGKGYRYAAERDSFGPGVPMFSDVPDGTYEIVNGKAEKIGVSGWSKELPEEHPLNTYETKRAKDLFNMGIEMQSFFSPTQYYQIFYPNRYAYYRDGDLYLLGAPILLKDDPTLQTFIANEKQKELQSTPEHPYKAYVDKGAPIKNGSLDVEFIQTHGLKIPEKHYLALGDNHAMSKDSRIVGFIPEDNLQGAPSYLIWPPGARWGASPQTPYPTFITPRLIIWTIVLVIFVTWYIYNRRRLSQRLFKENK